MVKLNDFKLCKQAENLILTLNNLPAQYLHL